MPMHRKNSSKGGKRTAEGEQGWFRSNTARARRAKALAKESRRKNRSRK